MHKQDEYNIAIDNILSVAILVGKSLFKLGNEEGLRMRNHLIRIKNIRVVILLLIGFLLFYTNTVYAKEYCMSSIDGTMVSTTPSSPKKLNVIIFGRPTCFNTATTIKNISNSSWVSADNVGFIYADVDGNDRDSVSEFANSYSPSITFCYGNNNSIAWDLSGASGNVSLPFVVYVDSEGNVANAVTGIQSSKEVYDSIYNILGDEAPEADKGSIYTVQTLSSNRYEEARTMLSLINDFRSGNDAWYWNSDNTTKTMCTDLGTLTYDYELEKVAVERAKELTVYYSHTRPNGESCFTAYPSGKYYTCGENIACGQGTAEQVFRDWREDNDDYSGQGHRRNMLNDDFNAVGFACFEVGGIKCWVQEFGYKSSFSDNDLIPTTYSDELKKYDIEVSAELINPMSLNYEKELNLEINETKIKDMSIYFMTGYAFPGAPIYLPTTVTVADSGIISVEDKKVTGQKIGKTLITLSTKIGEKTVTEQISVSVNPISISGSTVTLSENSFDYTGADIKPSVKVVLGNVELIENQDYTLSYSDNINPGNASVTITGVGNYGSSKIVNFTIKDKKKESSVQNTTVNQNNSDKNYDYDVEPSKVSGFSLRNIRSKKIRVTWMWQADVDKFQVQYALNRSFTKAKKTKTVSGYSNSKTIKGLKKGKTYYVRVRGYNNSSYGKLYGKWSVVKKVKIKK